MFSVFDLLVLSQIPQIGQNRLRMLVSHFGEPSEVIRASAKEIAAVEGFNKKLASHITHFFRGSDYEEAKRSAERQLSKLNKVEGQLVTFWEKRYPEALKKIYDPPPFLFVHGEFTEQDQYAIAIVGTRTPSSYGVTMAERFSHDIAKYGITIVSGLARGIDTIAHLTALKDKRRTLAVMGSGLDVIYPSENKSLAERIAQHGALISEYEMGAKPDAVNFPRRNRIISGLSLGALIIESDVGGGAMITASTALDQNREVFALPGNINSKRSHGCNTLIKDGRAKLVETVDDIIAELGPKLRPLLKDAVTTERKQPIELTLFEKKLYDILSNDPRHIDTIAEQAACSTADALINLLSLEFKNLVKQLPGKMFIRVDDLNV
jgi:DNA processing protein